ncbi:MAG: hypothetical protein JST50_01655 [Bacteroidetes bacterium]|jgi:hypothetical protein|nr:hypothetical protein [Bacteroidota bacterium]
MATNPLFDRYFEMLNKIRQTEQTIINTPQFKILDGFVNRLMLKKESQATIYIEMAKTNFSIEDLKAFVDIHCFESVLSVADEKVKIQRLFVIEFILIGHPLVEEVFKYIKHLASDYNDQQEGALNLLFSYAVKNFRREELLTLLDKNIASFNKAMAHKTVNFLKQYFKDNEVAEKIILKANK